MRNWEGDHGTSAALLKRQASSFPACWFISHRPRRGQMYYSNCPSCQHVISKTRFVTLAAPDQVAYLKQSGPECSLGPALDGMISRRAFGRMKAETCWSQHEMINICMRRTWPQEGRAVCHVGSCCTALAYMFKLPRARGTTPYLQCELTTNSLKATRILRCGPGVPRARISLFSEIGL